MKVKNAPERWQDNEQPFDIVIAFEERVFEAIVDGKRKMKQEGESKTIFCFFFCRFELQRLQNIQSGSCFQYTNQRQSRGRCYWSISCLSTSFQLTNHQLGGPS